MVIIIIHSNFLQLPSGKYPMELILEQDENLKFEIDIGWATAGKVNPGEMD